MIENTSEERSTAETFVIYAALLWHWAWVLLLTAILAGAAVYWRSGRQTPIYQASTTVSVNIAPSSPTITASALSTSEQLAATYAQEMVMQPVLDLVAKRLNLAAFPISATLQVTPVNNTQLLRIVVLDNDPQRAAQLSNTLVKVFIDKIQADEASRYASAKKSLQDQMTAVDQHNQTAAAAVTAMNKQIQETTNTLNTVTEKIQTETATAPPPTALLPQLTLVSQDTIDSDKNQRDQLQVTLVQYQSQLTQLQATQTQYQQSYNNLFQSYQSLLLAEAQSSSGVTQQNPAVPPALPISPTPIKDALLAAVVGLMIAGSGVFLVEFLDDTIRDPDEITRRWGVPVLGTIISYPHDQDTLITAKEPRSPITEAFRSLRTNLQFAGVNVPIHTILVTSPSPQDGKTTVVANLGSVIAQGGRKVVVVDADLRRPRVHKVLGVSNRNGLSNQFLRVQDHLNGSVKPTEVEGLNVVTSGNLPPNPSELLGSVRMTDILSELAGKFDTVLLDAPPLLAVTDALVLAPAVDGVLIVVKPTITRRAALKNMLDQLRQVKANVLGIVLNDVKISRSRYYNYHGYYYSRKYGKGYGYANTEPETSPETPPETQDQAKPLTLADAKEKLLEFGSPTPVPDTRHDKKPKSR